jgi:hypothetical protein
MVPTWEAVSDLCTALMNVPAAFLSKDVNDFASDMCVYTEHFEASALKEELKAYAKTFSSKHSQVVFDLLRAFKAEWRNAGNITVSELCTVIQYVNAKIAGQAPPVSRTTFTNAQNNFAGWLTKFPLREKNLVLTPFDKNGAKSLPGKQASMKAAASSPKKAASAKPAKKGKAQKSAAVAEEPAAAAAATAAAAPPADGTLPRPPSLHTSVHASAAKSMSGSKKKRASKTVADFLASL